MESIEQDLLLLMLNLSRMRDRERILRLYVEAVSAMAPGVTVRILAPEEPEGAGELLEVATPDAAFGRLSLDDPEGRLAPADRARLRNATRMLAVVLENAGRADRLASENARLDAAVAARTAELQRALERLEDLYQHAPCGYHSLDESAVYVRVNETEARWLGYGGDELVGKRKFTDLVTPGSLVRFLHGFQSVKQGHAEVAEAELELVCKDGAILPVLMRATAVRDEAGRFVMSRGTMFDLSERRRAERTLRDTEERFRQSQKLEALGRLAGGVAHDFNNLLTVIVSCSEVLLDALAPENPLREDAGEIADAAAKAAQLTRQLLAFGRRQPSNPVPLDVGETVSGMEKMLRRLIGEDVELVISRQAGLMPIQADPGRIEQVVLNLVVNARDAMPAGGRVVIETSNAPRPPGEGGGPPGAFVCLAVSDTGTGMTGEVRSHLFEPFFTTKAEGKGTGLGLATVYGIVKQAGGDVRVESEPGRGTRFEVLLPAAPPEVALAAESTAHDRVMPGSETVLLVEDEQRVRAAEAQMLRRAGYTVIEAPDGETALGIAAGDGRIDVLVTDLVMPRLGGAALAAKLRKLRGGVPVVFVSGYGGEVLAGDDLGDDTAPVLQKPFTAAALTRAIRERLAARGRPAARPGAPLTPGS